MKKVVLFIIFLLVTTNVFSQSPSWLWAKKAVDSVVYDYSKTLGSKISTDPNGNIFVAGNFYGFSMDFGSFTINGTCFLVKYDPSGNVIWAKGLGGNLKAISTDNIGNVIITGTFTDTLDLGSDTLIGNQAFFIAKYDTSGNLLWANSSNGTSSLVVGENITIDKNNNIYAIGYYNSLTVTFSGVVLNALGYNNMFIVKYDSSGNIIWAKTQQGGGAEGQGVSHDSFGNIYFTGFFGSTAISFGSLTLVPKSNYDIFIVKSDSLGNFLWAKSGNKIANDDEGYHIATDSLGNSYVIGQYFNDSIFFDGINLTNNGSVTDDFFIVKYDPIGNVIWAKSEGGTNYDFANDIKTDKYGNIYVTGTFWNSTITFGTTSLSSLFGSNLFIVKYNSLGNVLWAKSSTGTSGNNNYSNGIAIDNIGNVYIEGGFSNSNISFGSTVLNNTISAYDFFISKLSQCTITGATISDTSCNVITLNGETFYNSGSYIQTLETLAGCDSIINLNLTINSIDSTITQFACETYSLNGITYTNSGLYHQNYSSFTGCDSTYTLNLTIDDVNTSITQSTLWLCSNQNGVQYQWIDCANNFALLSSETNQVFYPSSNGVYAAIIINPSGCFDTSACYTFTNLSITDNSFNNSISIYPNPFSSITTIVFAEEQKNTAIKITNVLGREIKTINFDGNELSIEKGEMNNGIYFIQITDEKKNVANRKIIIQ